MILDSDGNELTYWPISGLKEGEDSEQLNFTVPIPGTGSELTSTLDDRVIMWVKKVGDVSFTNLSSSPYSLAGLSGDVDFVCYVEALTSIEGLERVPVTINAATSESAGWTV